MPNPIKYSTGSESEALKKGNMFIGTGAVGKGPSDATGYYQGPAVPSGGYVIYVNRVGAPGGLSYHSAANDAQLIAFTNGLAGQSYTTVQQCFDYYYGQNDKVLVNQDYPADYPYIVMDGLVLYLDAGITQSYPGSGTTWTDVNGLGPKNNGALTNGPTFNSANGGSIVFDGTNDYVNLGTYTKINYLSGDFAIDCWVYYTGIHSSNGANVIGNYYTGNSGVTGDWQLIFAFSKIFLYSTGPGYIIETLITTNTWLNIVVSRISSTMKLYVNNVEKSSVSNSTNMSRVGGNLNIGIDGNNSEEPFGGRIAVIRMYNEKGLSSTEIAQNYNAQKGRFGL
jgi:hypothetical protein